MALITSGCAPLQFVNNYFALFFIAFLKEVSRTVLPWPPSHNIARIARFG